MGSVIATDKAIIPAAVGVDIGYGMNAVRFKVKAGPECREDCSAASTGYSWRKPDKADEGV
ncbi:MAG: hypothetical protein ACREUR_07630 [Nitrosospira sp.]